MANSRNILIDVNAVTKYYGKVCALDNVSMQLKSGECVGIIGRNGSGKSTLVNIMIKMVKATSGTVNYSFPEKNLPYLVGAQFQETTFEALFKVHDVVNFYGGLYGVSQKRKISLLKEFDLEKLLNRYAVKLSGGEKQKLNILLTLLNNPEILIFDEITTGLDAISRTDIYNRLEQIKKTGKSIILVSHYFDEIEKLCDRVIVLKQGKKIFEGTHKDVMELNGTDYSSKLGCIIGGN